MCVMWGNTSGFPINKVSRVATDLENLEKSGNLPKKSENLPKKSGNLRQNSKSQGKVRKFCCLKFMFSQVEDREFENFLGGACPLTALNGLGLMIELNLGLEKSGNFILTGKWQP